jgi:hypothetical protein
LPGGTAESAVLYIETRIELLVPAASEVFKAPISLVWMIDRGKVVSALAGFHGSEPADTKFAIARSAKRQKTFFISCIGYSYNSVIEIK